MKEIMEPTFEIIYLAVGLILSILTLAYSKKRITYIIFGAMGLTLVIGDSAHLVPRILDAWNIPVTDIYAMLGIGKAVTSITMTIFYVLLYWFYKLKYNKKNTLHIDIIVYVLALVRILLCLLPDNDWTSPDSPYMWGIYRNIPFVVLGVLMVILSYKWTKQANDKYFRYSWIAISLSFVFYLLTVTVSYYVPLFGLFMIPKTICYIWILIMGFRSARKIE